MKLLWDMSIQGDNIREFKKLRRQLQRKLHIKIELCVKLSLLRLFHVDHVVQNRRTELSLAWYEWFSCEGNKKNIAPKSVPHVQHDYFSSFNQSNFAIKCYKTWHDVGTLTYSMRASLERLKNVARNGIVLFMKCCT